MVTKYIKDYEVVSEKTPIISVEFDNIPDFSDMFDEKNLQRHNYGNLSVEQGRFIIEKQHHTKTFINFKKDFYETIEFLSIELLKLDPIRYPINKDLKEWFAEKIKSKNNWNITIVLDRPGFFMPWHLDNRLIIISGVLNLDQNCSPTMFQSNDSGWGLGDFVGDKTKLTYQGSTDKYKGTFWLNTDLTWHAVPKVSTERKIALFNVFF
jgi:hypothetical protein